MDDRGGASNHNHQLFLSNHTHKYIGQKSKVIVIILDYIAKVIVMMITIFFAYISVVQAKIRAGFSLHSVSNVCTLYSDCILILC